MAYPTKAAFETIRSINFTAVTGALETVGPPLENPCRMIKLVSTMDKLLYLSFDGENIAEVMPPNSFVIWDFSSNKIRDDGLFLTKGSQISILAPLDLPTEGRFFITAIYAKGGG